MSLATVHDESASASSVGTILEQLELELADKVTQMRDLVEMSALRLEQDCQQEIVKLAPWLKTMSMRDFCVKYGGDIAEAERQHVKLALSNDPLLAPPAQKGGKGASAAASKKRTGADAGLASAPPSALATPGGARSTRKRVGETPRGGSSAMATPAGRGTSSSAVAFTPKVGETPRLMKGDEVAHSANGSPLVVPNTIKAKVGGGKRNAAADTEPSVLLTLADGTEVSVESTNDLASLPTDEKEQAVANLEQLAKQIDAHLKALKGGHVPEI